MFRRKLSLRAIGEKQPKPAAAIVTGAAVNEPAVASAPAATAQATAGAGRSQRFRMRRRSEGDSGNKASAVVFTPVMLDSIIRSALDPKPRGAEAGKSRAPSTTPATPELGSPARGSARSGARAGDPSRGNRTRSMSSLFGRPTSVHQPQQHQPQTAMAAAAAAGGSPPLATPAATAAAEAKIETTAVPGSAAIRTGNGAFAMDDDFGAMTDNAAGVAVVAAAAAAVSCTALSTSSGTAPGNTSAVLATLTGGSSSTADVAGPAAGGTAGAAVGGATAGKVMLVGHGVSIDGLEVEDAEIFVVDGRVLNGRVQANEVRVTGTFQGSLECRHIQVTKGATVIGRVVADTADVAGRVEGALVVRVKLSLHVAGRARSFVRYGDVVAAPGSRLIGDVGVYGGSSDESPLRQLNCARRAAEELLARRSVAAARSPVKYVRGGNSSGNASGNAGSGGASGAA
ncbi:unnamed protein product, partial [Phaeothamnion confervicola]